MPGDSIPLLPMQADFFATYDGDVEWDFTPVVVEFTGTPLTGAYLADRITSALRPHQALSVAFRRNVSGSWQQFAGADPITCDVDVLSTAGHDSEEEWATKVLDRLRSQINIQAGRPVVARLVQTSSQRSYLFLLCHHLAVDALSLQLLLKDISRAVTSPVRLADQSDPTTDFAATARRMRELADSQEIRDELRYWYSLPLSQGVAISADHPGKSHTEGTSASVGIRLSPDSTAGLVRLARTEGLHVGDLLTVAAGIAALDVFDCDAVAVDTAIHGRDLELPGISVTEVVGRLAVNVPAVLCRVGSAEDASAETGTRSVKPKNFVSYDPQAARCELFDIAASMIRGGETPAALLRGVQQTLEALGSPTR